MRSLVSSAVLLIGLLGGSSTAHAQQPTRASCLYESQVRTNGSTGFVRYLAPDTVTFYALNPSPGMGGVLRHCAGDNTEAVFIPSGRTLYDYAHLPGGGLAALSTSYQDPSQTEILFTVYDPNGQRRASFGIDGQLRVGSGRAAFGGGASSSQTVQTTILPQREGGFILTGLPQGPRRLSAGGDSLALTPDDSLTYLCPVPATGGARPAARVLPHDSGRFGRGDARFLVICGSTLRRFLGPGVPDASFGDRNDVVLHAHHLPPAIYHLPSRRYLGSVT